MSVTPEVPWYLMSRWTPQDFRWGARPGAGKHRHVRPAGQSVCRSSRLRRMGTLLMAAVFAAGCATPGPRSGFQGSGADDPHARQVKRETRRGSVHEPVGAAPPTAGAIPVGLRGRGVGTHRAALQPGPRAAGVLRLADFRGAAGLLLPGEGDGPGSAVAGAGAPRAGDAGAGSGRVAGGAVRGRQGCPSPCRGQAGGAGVVGAGAAAGDGAAHSKG